MKAKISLFFFTELLQDLYLDFLVQFALFEVICIPESIKFKGLSHRYLGYRFNLESHNFF